MYVCMYVSVYLSKGKETAAPPYIIYIYIYIVIGCMLAWMQVDVDQ